MLGQLPSLSTSLDKAHSGTRILKRDLLSRVGEHYTVKPRVLNFLANDICNAECTMCNIWEQMPEQTLTPEEFADVLEDPLFDKLEYIGVSGGEPTLRNDLPELFEAIVKTRPGVKTGIITNALVPEVVLNRVERSARICQRHDVPFNAMVSLDGVGEVHDRVRGTDGAFENATHVIQHLRDETGIPVSVGCTVTKENVWNVHELKAFCEAEDLNYKFRVAEFIDRLYNDDNETSVRNFTDRERYHLGLFFAELEQETPVYAARRRSYRNIRKMLLEDADRSIGCYMHTHGATLDSSGQLMYCAPKSPQLGDTTERSAREIYRENTNVRNRIKSDHCRDCIHDYPSPRIATELDYLPKRLFWRERLSVDAALAEYRVKSSLPGWYDSTTTDASPEEVLVFGWYGTETAGDKAILGQILHDIETDHPQANVTLASLYPYLSRWTLQELGYPDVEVVPTYSRTFLQYAKTADEVVMGGGPLMHIKTLGVVLTAFMKARAAGNRTRLAGCGVGPLDKAPKYEDAVAAILELTDDIELRSDADVREAKRLSGRFDAVNTGDPAFEYVHRWAETTEFPEPNHRLNLYLRDWPADYRGDLTETEFKELKRDFEAELGNLVRTICERDGLQPRLVPMHHFHVGNDDRAFNRRFAAEHLDGLDPIVEERPFTLNEVLRSMTEAEKLLCMRYHSVAFANELGVDFQAIDYSRGGKVERYLRDVGKTDRMLKIPDIAAGRWTGSTAAADDSPR